MLIFKKFGAMVDHLRVLLDYSGGHASYMRERLAELGKRKTSNTAFLVATGPSIRRQNLSLLEGQDCFTVSNAFLHSDINRIKPIAHGFASYHEPMDWENFVAWLNLASEKIPESSAIYTTTRNRKLVQESGIGRTHDVVFGLYEPIATHLWPVHCKYLFIPPQSGPLLMLPLIMAMGYSRICLVGCDHTTLRDYGGYIRNFYDRHEDVRKHATDPSIWPDIRAELSSNIALFDQYAIYSAYANMHSINIVNLSDDSWLREFEFSTIEKEISKTSEVAAS